MQKWNALDKLIARFRYVQLNQYVIPQSIVLDVGCGREAAFLYSHREEISQGYGLDFRIDNREDGNIRLINNRGQKCFPIEDNSVDTVFMNAVLEHVAEPEKLLSECFRVLKSRGRLVMTTPTKIAKPILEFMAFRLHIINEEEIKEHVHYYNRKDIEKLLSAFPCAEWRYKLFELGVNSLIVAIKQ